jgi:hypothetical protein
MILGITNQKLWVFEVFWRSLAGWACAGANQQELTTCAKSGEQEEKQKSQKNEQGLTSQVSTCGWSPAGPGPLTNSQQPAVWAWSPSRDQAPTSSHRWPSDQRSPTSRRSKPGLSCPISNF